jgi:hypothetical protein
MLIAASAAFRPRLSPRKSTIFASKLGDRTQDGLPANASEHLRSALRKTVLTKPALQALSSDARSTDREGPFPTPILRHFTASFAGRILVILVLFCAATRTVAISSRISLPPTASATANSLLSSTPALAAPQRKRLKRSPVTSHRSPALLQV